MSSNVICSVVSKIAVSSSNHQSVILRNSLLFKDLIRRGKIAENIANFAKCCFVQGDHHVRHSSTTTTVKVDKKNNSKFQNFVQNFLSKFNTNYASSVLVLFNNNRLFSTAVKGEEAIHLNAVEEKAAPVAAVPTAQNVNIPQQQQQTTTSTVKKFEISYDELVSTYLNLEEKFLFDVREPTEIMETGAIPNAVNLPLTKLKSSFQLEDSEFALKYNIRKPTIGDSNLIIFYGLSSVKGMSALEIAHKLGYKKARYFPGGFEEWKQKENANLI